MLCSGKVHWSLGREGWLTLWFFAWHRDYNNTIVEDDKNMVSVSFFFFFFFFSLNHSIWWVKDLFSCQIVNTISHIHPCSAPPSFPFTQMPAPLWCYLRWQIRAGAKLSPISASETFTQTARWSVSTWFPHWKGSHSQFSNIVKYKFHKCKILTSLCVCVSLSQWYRCLHIEPEIKWPWLKHTKPQPCWDELQSQGKTLRLLIAIREPFCITHGKLIPLLCKNVHT